MGWGWPDRNQSGRVLCVWPFRPFDPSLLRPAFRHSNSHFLPGKKLLSASGGLPGLRLNSNHWPLKGSGQDPANGSASSHDKRRKPVAADGTFADLRAHHNCAADRLNFCKPGLCLKAEALIGFKVRSTIQEEAMESTTFVIEVIESPIPPQAQVRAGPSNRPFARQTPGEPVPRRRRCGFTRRPVWERMRTTKPDTRFALAAGSSRLRLVMGRLCTCALGR